MNRQNIKLLNFERVDPLKNKKEKSIEKRLVDGVKALGGRCYKWVSPGNSGVPDRIVLLDGKPSLSNWKGQGGLCLLSKKDKSRGSQKLAIGWRLSSVKPASIIFSDALQNGGPIDLPPASLSTVLRRSHHRGSGHRPVFRYGPWKDLDHVNGDSRIDVWAVFRQ